MNTRIQGRQSPLASISTNKPVACQLSGKCGLAGRLLVLVLLGLALWNPTLPGKAHPLEVFVLVDESLSMDSNFITAAWSRLSRLLNQLPAGSHYTLIRFAAQPVMEVQGDLIEQPGVPVPLPRTRPLDASATHIEAALQLAFATTVPGRSPVMVLISDGGETAGQAARELEHARRDDITVFGLAPGTPGANTVDARITALQLPARSRVGREVPVTATLFSSRDQAGTLRLLLNNSIVAHREVTLSAGQQQSIGFSLPLESQGPQTVTVTLHIPGDQLPANNHRSAIVNVDGLMNILYVNHDTEPAPMARSLIAGGRDLQVIKPALLGQYLQGSEDVSTIILDDIAISDMPAHTWATLARSVRTRGTGLVVLGGPRSFGAGGYRESTLETLLPVTAESRDPAARAAVLFVVDKSGSMDRDNGKASRFAYARQAILGTAGILLDADLTGLIAFDTEPQTWLPLESHAEPGRKLDSAWQHTPSGGTRIKPALVQALAQLKAATADQRLLVVVTDGFVGDTDFSGLRTDIETAAIDVIVMAVGREPELGLLHELADLNNGILLRIDDVATLPELMNETVGMRRSAYEGGRVNPREVSMLPFLAESKPSWPSLQGYMVTRERPDADVYLRSERGDPLLAVQHAGVGKVVALPAGLGDWARAWQQWPLWGQLVGGLVDWTGAQAGNPNLHIAIEEKPGEHRIVIDAVNRNHDWDSSDNTLLTLRDPVDRLTEIELERSAPGRYTARLPVRQAGRYRVSVQIGDNSLQHEFLYNGHDEIAARDAGMQRFSSWQDSGLIRPFPDGDSLDKTPERRGLLPLRTPLLALAMVIYIGLLVIGYLPATAGMYNKHRT